MKNIKKTLVVLILCSFIMGTIPVSVLAQQNSLDDNIFEYKGPDLPDGVEYVPGELIVEFKPGVSNKEIANINSKHGTSVKYTSPYAGFKVLHVPKGKTVSEMVEIFSKNPNVEYVVTNSIAHAFMSPNDPLYHYQWHLDDSSSPNPYGGTNGGGINIEPAWDISNGTGVVIAVLDTGVAYEDYEEYMQAPDLANTHFVAGWDFINNDSHANDDDSHGTHVTGTIAQSTNNTLGTAGVAFNSSIMPIKVLGNDGGTLQQLVDGIHFATDNGANVISMSLGWPAGYDPGQPLKDALDYAYINNVTIVCAAGNDGRRTISYPAAYDKCIAVGATRYNEERAKYSNWGPGLDIMAPGGDMKVDQNGDGYGDGVLQNTFNPNTKNTSDFSYWFFQGTSMATPHVSAVAALVISAGVATTPDEVREVLQSTAEDKGSAGWDPQYGHGIVDAYAALNYASAPNEPPTSDAGGPYSGDEGVAINFDGSGSFDPDGNIVSYEWVFGDGGIGSGVIPTYTYSVAGTYVVNLTVTDDDGVTGTDTATVAVNEATASPTLHLASIDMSTDTKSAGPNVFTWALATVTIVDSSNNPVSGAQVTGTWSELTSDSDTAPTGANGIVTVRSDSIKNAAGIFTFTVTDVTYDGLIWDEENNIGSIPV